MTLSRLFRVTAMMLVSVLWLNGLVADAARPVDPAVMKAKVQAHGVGQGVRVTLADKTEVKGLVVSISDQSFLIKAKNAPQAQEIQYAQITGVHNAKLGTGTKVIIIVAVAGAAVGITAAILVHEVDNSLKNIQICPQNECT